MADKLGLEVQADTTSLSLPALLRQVSDGLGKTGLLATNLTASYWRQGEEPTTFSLSDLANIDSAWASGGVKEASNTLHKGIYRLDVPDAAWTTGADWVIVSLSASGCYEYHREFMIRAAMPSSVLSLETAALNAIAGALGSVQVPGAFLEGSLGYILGNTSTLSELGNGHAGTKARIVPALRIC